MRKGTWNHGITGYQRYKCRCETCVEAAKAVRARHRPYSYNSKVRLDAQVLIDRLDADGRWYDRNMARRLIQEGVSVYAADRWAVRYGYHPYEIWGDAFYEGCEYEPAVAI